MEKYKTEQTERQLKNNNIGYIEKWLSNAVRITIVTIITSFLFRGAKSIFSFALKFKLTGALWNMGSSGIFGLIIVIILTPFSLAFDILTFFLGLLIGLIIMGFVFIIFPFLLIYVFIKS